MRTIAGLTTGLTAWKRQFVAYFFFISWDCLSLGLHVCLSLPNIEIHLPFGFVRIGWTKIPLMPPINYTDCKKRCFGLSDRY